MAAISMAAYAVFALAVMVPAVESLELKVLDSFQKVRLKQFGPRFSPDLAVISVDDQSVDPSVSPLSDVWGRGGWLTRDLWVQQMQFHLEYFRPRVLSYDILFLPSENVAASETAEALARLQTMDSLAARRRQIAELESSGNDELENQILNMKDARDSGDAGPYPIFAYYFPTGRQARREALREEDWDSLRRRALPEGAVMGSTDDVRDGIVLPLSGILHADAGLGAINVPPDPGGVVRRVPLVFTYHSPRGETLHLPSFALSTYLHARGIDPASLHVLGKGTPGIRVEPGRRLLLETAEGRLEVPIDRNMALFLNHTFRFTGGPTNLSYIKVSQAGLTLAEQNLHGRMLLQSDEQTTEARRYAGLLRDRVVFIAQAWTGSGDIGSFPLEENTPNVLAHMLAVDNLMRRDFLLPPSRALTLVFGLLAAAFSLWIYRRFSVGTATVVLLAVTAFYPFAAYGMLVGVGRGLHVLTPMGLLLLLFGAHAFHQFLREAHRRREVRKLFSSMVSPRVLELLEQQPASVLMEGRRMDATLFFSDVAGFTSISEKLAPQELSALLNRYLTPMSDIVLSSDGYVDKYLGDGLMAAWGVPYPDPDHAVKACRAARDQLRALHGLAAEIESECGVRIDIRIGINTGPVSAGNMGSARKFQYTVMGDAVNLAARLEPANKDYGSRCILGPLTGTAARKDPGLVLRRLDRLVVKGKTEPVEIYELCELDQPEPWIADYEKALEALWARDWDRAEAGFRAVQIARPGDGPSALMLTRLAAYRLHPPAPDWNGAWVRAAKD